MRRIWKTRSILQFTRQPSRPPRKPERIKEIPDFCDPEIEVEDAFDILVRRLQPIGEWWYALVEGESLYFPPYLLANGLFFLLFG
jgi:hypothetical protein